MKNVRITVHPERTEEYGNRTGWRKFGRGTKTTVSSVEPLSELTDRTPQGLGCE
jgi:hypothetical protein